MTEPLHPQDPRASYYASARSWAEDAQAAPRRAARIAWIAAGVAASVAALEAMALIVLMPLKTVVPYTLLVDRNTGFAQVLAGGQVPQVTGQAALEQSLLAQYVVAREGFDVATAQAQYGRVALWSAGAARAEYLALMPATNPDSPQNQVPHGGVLAAQVESVSLMGPGMALVRFATRRQGAGGGDNYWVAVVHYRFSGQPMALEERLANPLGFQVTQYRRDQEAPPVAAPPPAPSAPLPLIARAPVQTPAAIANTPVARHIAPRAPWMPPHLRRMMRYRPNGVMERGQ